MKQTKTDEYTELYKLFGETILRRSELISQKTAYYYDAEDIAQELFLKLFLEMGRYDETRGEKENFYNKVLLNARKDIVKKAWARKNGLKEHRVYLDQINFDERREEAYATTMHDVVVAKNQKDFDAMWAEDLLKDDILEILKDPSLVRAREMIFWYLCGYRQMEIAERMHCSQSNVSIKIKQFRKLLKEKTAEKKNM